MSSKARRKMFHSRYDKVNEGYSIMYSRDTMAITLNVLRSTPFSLPTLRAVTVLLCSSTGFPQQPHSKVIGKAFH